MTHLIIINSSGQRIEYWTEHPEVLEQRYREGGFYVLEGGQPQPVHDDASIDSTSAFASRR